MTSYDKVDFFRDASLVDDPVPYYDYLRAQGPVVPMPEHSCVAVLGFEECLRVYKDVETFSACNSATGPLPPPLPVLPEGDDASDLIERYRNDMPYGGELVTLDPPRHAASRSLLMRLFTPSRLKAIRPLMIEASDRLIDEFADTGRAEIISQYGGPFATLVIAGLLGVPEQDRAELRRILSTEEREKINSVPGQVGGQKKGLTPFDFLGEIFTRYIEECRTEPQDDILSELAHATFPDGSVPDATEIVRLTIFLFAAGQDSTARFMASALRLISENPDVQERLRADGSLIPNAVEEALRMEGPTKTEGRLARVTTSISGVPVPAGTSVLLMISAANRDPRRFEDPHLFKLGRPRIQEHIAFGRGAHTCAGAPLARAESIVSLERFLSRFASIGISAEHHGPAGARHFEYTPTYLLRGLKQLHLDLTPA